MEYPKLKITPIKETIFSVSYEEIIDENCFDEFLKLDSIKNKFEAKPSINQELKIHDDDDDGGGIKVQSIKNGFHLKSNNIILQLRKGSFSFHFLNGYKKFELLLEEFEQYWSKFDTVTKDDLTITNYSVRYINVIETDDENQATHLIQLYPKQSKDRNIKNFQNSVQFSYTAFPKYVVNAVSTKLNNKGILLDISVNGKKDPLKKGNIELKTAFIPMQVVKNKAFFDSITARALLKYIPKN